MRKRVDRRALELARTIIRYEVQNDRFAVWLDERDRAERERTAKRLADAQRTAARAR